LGISEFLKDQVKLYPNPVSELLFITISKSIAVEGVYFCDLLGREVLKSEKRWDQIDVSRLKSGVFFVEVKTTRGLIREKVIKQ
jgi:hypothetical protein